MASPVGDLAEALFAEAFKDSKPRYHVSAPGRVNIIGEHTDYNGGFVLPIAICKRTHVVGCTHASGTRCRVVTANESKGEVVEFEATTEGLKPDQPVWANYVKGVVAQYLDDLPAGARSFDLALASDVPLGGGLSSSASLEVAIAAFLEQAFGLRVDPKERALRCQKAEHDWANVPCGIMDQMVSSCGVRGHALLIDCRPPFETRLVPVDDPGIAFVVANSNVRHTLSGSEYPDRVRQCAGAAAIIRSKFPSDDGQGGKPMLRGASMAELLACKGSLSEMEFRRARHVISEDIRTGEAVEAFSRGDYSAAGRLMLESHASLRDDFEVSTPELDALVEIARGVDGVYGARMTGGGFGGCTVTLVKAAAAQELMSTLEVEYERRVGKRPTCFATKAGPGPTVSRSFLGSPAARILAAAALAAVAAVAVAVIKARARKA